MHRSHPFRALILSVLRFALRPTRVFRLSLLRGCGRRLVLFARRANGQRQRESDSQKRYSDHDGRLVSEKRRRGLFFRKSGTEALKIATSAICSCVDAAAITYCDSAARAERRRPMGVLADQANDPTSSRLSSRFSRRPGRPNPLEARRPELNFLWMKASASAPDSPRRGAASAQLLRKRLTSSKIDQKPAHAPGTNGFGRARR